MNAGKTVLIDAFPESAFRHGDCDAVVCIDVMLATTTLVTAVAQGRRAFAAATGADLDKLAATLSPALLAGSLEEFPLRRFELPDSPCELVRREADRRPLVLASTPGTQLIANAKARDAVLIACFRNLSATASYLTRHRRVALLSAGCRQEVSCEDQMAAAWLAERLLPAGFAPADRRTSDMVRRWSGIAPTLAGWGNSAAALRRAGRGEDVDFVIAHVDDVPQACPCDGVEVRLECGSPDVRLERELRQP